MSILIYKADDLRKCNVCCSGDDVREIKFRNDENYNSTTIALCMNCRLELSKETAEDIEVLRQELNYYKGLAGQLKASLEKASDVKVTIIKVLTFLEVLEHPIGAELQKETVENYSKKLKECLVGLDF